MKRGLDVFKLKLISLVFMITDHVYSYLNGPVHGYQAEALWPQWIPLLTRFVSPLFLYLMIEGFYHTRSRKKYLTRLLKFEQFKVQAQATLAILYSQIGNWAKAFDSSSDVVNRVPNDPSMQNILGLSAFNLGKSDIAIKALTEAIKYSPDNPVYHRDIGLVYKRLNRSSEAKEHFEKAAASKNSSEALRAEVLKELESLNNSQYQLQEYNKYGQ